MSGASGRALGASGGAPVPIEGQQERAGRPYGRRLELEEIKRLHSRLILVTGDGGVGKSELLRAVGAELRSSNSAVCSGEPVRLPHRPGALQQALFESLAQTLSEFDERTSLLERWGDLVTSAAGKVAQARLKGMVAGAGRMMLGMVRARAGEEAAELASELASAISKEDLDRLEHRVAAQADSDVLATFCALAQEVCELVDQPVVLLLDGAERLAEDDFRLLLDLAEQMPSGLHVVVTHSTAMADQVERVQRLDRLDADCGGTNPVQHVGLRPLDELALQSWVVAEPITPAVDFASLHRVTGGYPLHVDAALAALGRGEPLSGISGNRAFVSAMVTNVAALEPRAQELVARLAAHTDRPEEEQLLALVGMEPEEWAAQERYLQRARILVTNVNGLPWFHELGRRAIWFNVLSPRQRELSSRRSLDLFTTADVQTLTLQNSIDLVELVRADPEFAGAQSGVTEVLALDDSELGVLAAVVELFEPSSNTALNLDAVLRHARHRFEAGGDLIPVVRGLSDRGLLEIEETQDYAIVVPSLESAAAYLTAVGRMATRLPRVPTDALATRIFDAGLRPLLGSFAIAQFGIGALSATELSGRLKDAEWVEEDQVRRRHDRPGLIIRARLGELGLFAAVNFEVALDRDAALESLGAAAVGEVLGEPFVIDFLEIWPSPPLPEFRIASAVEVATGHDFRRRSGRDGALPAPRSVREMLSLHMRSAGAIRDILSPLERDALRLTRTLGFAYALLDGGYLLRADIQGWDKVVEVDLNPDFGQAHMFSNLERQLDLGPLDSLSSVHWGGITPTHPIPTLVEDSVKRLKAFNAEQSRTRLTVPMDDTALTKVLQDALDRRTRDAHALIEAGVLPPADRALGRSHCVLVTPDSAHPGRLRRPHGLAFVLSFEAVGEPVVALRQLDIEETTTFVDSPGGWFEVDSYRPWFDLPDVLESPAFSQSDTSDAIAALLDRERVHILYGELDRPGVDLPE
ncbi:MAG: ATP-binding protein [Actinobacteria bacterium]|nr:ATP-binding protein [Actinomycetota bacterium]